jgi:hypothetical protein
MRDSFLQLIPSQNISGSTVFYEGNKFQFEYVNKIILFIEVVIELKHEFLLTCKYGIQSILGPPAMSRENKHTSNRNFLQMWSVLRRSGFISRSINRISWMTLVLSLACDY